MVSSRKTWHRVSAETAPHLETKTAKSLLATSDSWGKGASNKSKDFDDAARIQWTKSHGTLGPFGHIGSDGTMVPSLVLGTLEGIPICSSRKEVRVLLSYLVILQDYGTEKRPGEEQQHGHHCIRSSQVMHCPSTGRHSALSLTSHLWCQGPAAAGLPEPGLTYRLGSGWPTCRHPLWTRCHPDTLSEHKDHVQLQGHHRPSL